MDTQATPAVPAGRTRIGAWVERSRGFVVTTYFAEGYPYAIVINLADLVFKAHGASLAAIGLASLLHLPWNLKFLWGSWIDRYETKRWWLLRVEFWLATGLGLLAWLLEGTSDLGFVAVAFLVLAVLAATHDIAIDGFYLEALDEREQSKRVGLRAMAYKVANLWVRGPMVVVAGALGWAFGMGVLALGMAGLFLLHLWLLPRCEERKAPFVALVRALVSPRSLTWLVLCAGAITVEWRYRVVAQGWGVLAARWPFVARLGLGDVVVFGLGVALLGALLGLPRFRRHLRGGTAATSSVYLSFLEQPGVARALAFVVTFRLGESFLQKMRWPMLDDLTSMTLEEYGIASGTVGLVVSFAATLVGGRLIARDGLRRWIWPFVLAQNVLNVLYIFVAAIPERFGFVELCGLIALEEAGAGLGTAVLMVYLMRYCDSEHKAGHFAILTALMSLGFTVAGVLSGVLAEALGYTWYFALTFVATIPMMVLLPGLSRLDARRPEVVRGVER